MTSDADILERAAARLEKPGAWGRYTFAADSNDTSVSPCDGAATRWCLVGAIRRELGTADASDREDELCGAIERYLGTWSVTDWNDTRLDVAPVVAALRETAKRLRGEQK